MSFHSMKPNAFKWRESRSNYNRTLTPTWRSCIARPARAFSTLSKKSVNWFTSTVLSRVIDLRVAAPSNALSPTAGSTVYIVDSMSAFGAIPVSLQQSRISYLISSANKCIEGIPGFAFVIAHKPHLLTCQGQSRSLALDLYDQYIYMEQSRQFRFTRRSIDRLTSLECCPIV